MTLLCFTSAENLRPIPCGRCCGEGRRWVSRYGGNDPDVWDGGPCTACNGSGEEWIEVAPIEMEDLP